MAYYPLFRATPQVGSFIGIRIGAVNLNLNLEEGTPAAGGVSPSFNTEPSGEAPVVPPHETMRLDPGGCHALQFRPARQENDMADAKSKTGDPDRERVSSLDYQVRSWARRYGVSEDRLREAVAKAGPTLRKAAKKAVK